MNEPVALDRRAAARRLATLAAATLVRPTALGAPAARTLRCESVSALRRATGSDGTRADVAAHAADVAGGGGTFVWDPATTAPDDDGLIIRPDVVGPGSPGRWVRRLAGEDLDLRMFGAKGDGVSDDRGPLQRAVEALLARGGGRLIVPRPAVFYSLRGGCHWRLTSAGVAVEMLGEGRPEFRYTGPSPRAYTILLRFDGPGQATSAAGTSLTLRGLRIAATPAVEQWGAGAPMPIYGLRVHAERVLVQDCTFRDLFGQGLQVGYYERADVQRTTFERVGGIGVDVARDVFGDAISFLAARSGAAVAAVEACRIEGYEVRATPTAGRRGEWLPSRHRLSRAGIVVEDRARGVLRVTGCTIRGYHRGVHVEQVVLATGRPFVSSFRVEVAQTTFDQYTTGVWVVPHVRSVEVSDCTFRRELLQGDLQTRLYGAGGPVQLYNPPGRLRVAAPVERFRLVRCRFELSSGDTVVQRWYAGAGTFDACAVVLTRGTRWTLLGADGVRFEGGSVTADGNGYFEIAEGPSAQTSVTFAGTAFDRPANDGRPVLRVHEADVVLDGARVAGGRVVATNDAPPTRRTARLTARRGVVFDPRGAPIGDSPVHLFNGAVGESTGTIVVGDLPVSIHRTMREVSTVRRRR